MKRFLPFCTLILMLAPALAGPPSYWKPPARKPYDITKDKVLYEVGYSHLDTQWRWTYLDTIGQYIPDTMLQNFALFEKYPDYTFSFTGSNRYRMMKEYYPKDYAKVKQYVDKGRWHVVGSSVEENDVNIASAESTIRQILYGNHYFCKEFGVTGIEYMIPDCFGFPASLPSVLAYCGMKGFSTQKLSWGSAVGIPFTVGRWYGPDGRFVVSALDPGPYNAHVNEDLSQSKFILDRINKTGDQSGAYVDYRYFGTGDVGGATPDSSAKAVVDSVHGSGPVTVVSAPADQMFKDLTPAQIAKLPSYTGDLALTEHAPGSYTSQAYMKRWNRKNELLADSSERASVAAAWLGAVPYPQDFINETWRLILGGQFHDILPGTSIPKAYEYSWNDEVLALNRSAGVVSDAAAGVIGGMDTRAEGVPVVVYNPLSIDREDMVEATVHFASAPANVRVFGSDGGEVPSQLVSSGGGDVKVLFLAKVPSVGFATFDLRVSDQPCAISTGLSVSEAALESPRYKVTLNEDGDVDQITDKLNGRSLLSAPARLALKFEEPRANPAWNIDWKDQSAPPVGYVTGPAKVRIVENGPARVAVEVSRENGHSRYVQIIRLSAGGAGNRVVFDNHVEWNERKTTLKAEFPLAVSNEKATYNLGVGAVERTTNDPKKYEVLSHRWFDLTDAKGDYGVSVLEDCKFGSDKPDDHTLRLTLIRTPGARSYFDQSTQDLGRHEFTYALEGHAGTWREGKTPWEADRLNQPLVAFTTSQHAGGLGKAFSLIRLNTDQVAVSALKKAEDGDDVIVRLQELNGSTAKVTISAAAPISSAREVDGQENVIGPAAVKGGVLTATLSAFSPRSFAIRLRKPPARIAPLMSKPIDLPYDTVAATARGESSPLGFDGHGHTFPAEMLPASLRSGGISFRLARGGAVACRGQVIPLPAGRYNKLYILASAVDGDASGTFTVGSGQFELSVQDWSGFIGQWYNRVWNVPADFEGLPKLDGGIFGLTPAYIKRDQVAYYATHRHRADGSDDIYAYAYIFRYGLSLPEGARTVTLPDEPRIRIFAMSAVTDPNGDTRPAQRLYDAFDQSQSTPVLWPPPGDYLDTTDVTVAPSFYDILSTVRYTTDGSQPTPASPKCPSRLTLAAPTMLRVRAFHGATPAGEAIVANYNVHDHTPPAIKDIAAMAGSTSIHVVFSEPVDRASAGYMPAYRIEALAVQSVEVSQDARSANLVVYPPLEAGRTYGLIVDGVTDQSENRNNLSMSTALPFAPIWPIVEVTGGPRGPVAKPGNAHLTVIGSPSPKAGDHGTGLVFDGVNDALVIPNVPRLNPKQAITLMAWIKPTVWDGNRRIIQKGDNDTQYRLTAENGHLVFDLAGIGAVQTDLPTVGVWHHVAATYDGTVMRIYVDGLVAGEERATGKMAVTADPLYIGVKNAKASAGNHFAGEMADVRLFGQALAGDQIRAVAGLK